MPSLELDRKRKTEEKLQGTESSKELEHAVKGCLFHVV